MIYKMIYKICSLLFQSCRIKVISQSVRISINYCVKLLSLNRFKRDWIFVLEQLLDNIKTG